MKVSEINFGDIDANDESLRYPQIFADYFLNDKEFVEELTSKFKFLVLGRKGTGKTALGRFIEVKSKKDPTTFVKFLSFKQFPFNDMFDMENKSEASPNQYKSAWNWVILTQLGLSLIENQNLINDENVIKLSKFFENNYGTLKIDSKKIIEDTKKRKFTVSAKEILSYENEKSHKQESGKYYEYIDDLESTIKNVNTTDCECRHFLIFDELDEAFRLSRKKYNDTLISLIKVANELNNSFYALGRPYKIMVLLRSDIFKTLNDTDLNKIKHGSAIELDWYQDVRKPEESRLVNLINLRINKSLGLNKEVNSWVKIFPVNIYDDKTSFKFVLEKTRHIPRDIVQYCKECQKLAKDDTKFSKAAVLSAEKKYSEYFRDEIRNELKGYYSDEKIDQLFLVLARVGNENFTIVDFSKALADFDELKNEDSKKLLTLMFEHNMVENVSVRKGKTFFESAYRNESLSANFDYAFCIHKGLRKVLNLRYIGQ